MEGKPEPATPSPRPSQTNNAKHPGVGTEGGADKEAKGEQRQRKKTQRRGKSEQKIKASNVLLGKRSSEETLAIAKKVLATQKEESMMTSIQTSKPQSLFFALRGRSKKRFALQCGVAALVYTISDDGNTKQMQPNKKDEETHEYLLKTEKRGMKFFVLLFEEATVKVLRPLAKEEVVHVLIADVTHEQITTEGPGNLWSEPQYLQTSIIRYRNIVFYAPLMVTVDNDMNFVNVEFKTRYFEHWPAELAKQRTMEPKESEESLLGEETMTVLHIEEADFEGEKTRVVIAISFTSVSNTTVGVTTAKPFEVKYRLDVRRPEHKEPEKTILEGDSGSQNVPASSLAPPPSFLVLPKGGTEMNRHLSYESREPSFSMYGLRAPRF